MARRYRRYRRPRKRRPHRESLRRTRRQNPLRRFYYSFSWRQRRTIRRLAGLIVLLSVAYLFINSGSLAILSTYDTSGLQEKFSLTAERKGECKDAFEYVNQLRKSEGKSTIQWDNKIYELAVFRSKDMYKQNYFDHITPEGECIKDFKSDFGLSDYIIAENVGGMTHHSGGIPVLSTNVNEAVDSWMSSRGHRYNLMYSEHERGAIGCYRHICVFLGAHHNPYGLGAGPCTTGAEGLKFWSSTSEQEGE